MQIQKEQESPVKVIRTKEGFVFIGFVKQLKNIIRVEYPFEMFYYPEQHRLDLSRLDKSHGTIVDVITLKRADILYISEPFEDVLNSYRDLVLKEEGL